MQTGQFRQEFPFKAVQVLLGHSTLATTQRYTRLGKLQLKDAVRLISKKEGHNMVTVGTNKKELQRV